MGSPHPLLGVGVLNRGNGGQSCPSPCLAWRLSLQSCEPPPCSCPHLCRPEWASSRRQPWEAQGPGAPYVSEDGNAVLVQTAASHLNLPHRRFQARATPFLPPGHDFSVFEKALQWESQGHIHAKRKSLKSRTVCADLSCSAFLLTRLGPQTPTRPATDPEGASTEVTGGEMTPTPRLDQCRVSGKNHRQRLPRADRDDLRGV